MSSGSNPQDSVFPPPTSPRRPAELRDRDQSEPAADRTSTERTESDSSTAADSGNASGFSSPFGNSGSAILFGLALAVAAFAMARMWRRRRSKQPLEAQVGEVRSWADAQLTESSTPLIGAPAEVRRWHVELETVVRDARAELDTKIVALQAVIRSAAQEATRLEKAIAEARSLSLNVGKEPPGNSPPNG